MQLLVCVCNRILVCDSDQCAWLCVRETNQKHVSQHTETEQMMSMQIEESYN